MNILAVYLLRGMYIAIRLCPVFIICLLVQAVFLNNKVSKQQMMINALCVYYFSILINVTGILQLRISVSEIIKGKYIAPNLIPFVDMDIKQGIMNAMLFIPLGMLLALRTPKERSIISVIITSMIASGTIEVLQLIGGRCFDIDDAIMNVMGAVIGYYSVFTIKKEPT